MTTDMATRDVAERSLLSMANHYHFLSYFLIALITFKVSPNRAKRLKAPWVIVMPV